MPARRHLRSDNAPEFVARRLLAKVQKAGIDNCVFDPGKPWQKGCKESFIGRFRDECLNMEWFTTRAEARVLIEACHRT